MKNRPRVTKANFVSALEHRDRPWQHNYLAMYSTWWGGITTDPHLMLVPVDDHLVHRGDGVFDVMRCVQGKIYQMDAHLRRLENSARAISLDMPTAYADIRGLVERVVRAGGEKDCLIRVTVSRGPGSFSPNPFDCPESQMYINCVRFKALPKECYDQGVALVTSEVPVKKAYFANIKSCNYLPNVLMKMEALNKGCMFSVALDEKGFLAEGSTENIGILTREGILKFPPLERVLSGITLRRVSELAEELVGKAEIADVQFSNASVQEAYQAREIFLTGTSINVLPVVRYDGYPIGEGSPGPLYRRLSAMLWNDMTGGSQSLTEIAWDEA